MGGRSFDLQCHVNGGRAKKKEKEKGRKIFHPSFPQAGGGGGNMPISDTKNLVDAGKR